MIGRRYEILRPLRWEPQGTVYLARDQILEVEVGLKFLPNDGPDFDRYLESYRQEAILGLKLHHPQILGVQHLDETAEGIFLIQEPCQGNSLAELLRHSDLLTQEDAVYLVEVLAQGLSCAHKQGLSHQYLHPEQILISTTAGIKIANFSFPPDLTAVQRDFEAAVYLPPEIWEGEAASPAGNIFSLGVIGYRMLTGRFPYPPAAGEGRPYALTPELQGLELLPPAWQGLLQGCLAASPSDRLASALDFLKELQCLYPNLTGRGWRDNEAAADLEAAPPLSQQGSRRREPEVAIDPLWEPPKRPPLATWWTQGLDWLRERLQRAKTLWGPEPLRRNRRKQVVWGGGGLAALILGTYLLGRLFLAPHPAPEPELTAAVDRTLPALQAVPESKTSDNSAAANDRPATPTAPTGAAAGPAPALVQPQPAPPALTAPPAPAPQVSRPARAAIPGRKEGQRAAAKPKTQESARKGAVPRLVGTYATEAQARQQASLLQKQGKKAVVRKVSINQRPKYQVVLLPAAGAGQTQAIARSRPGPRPGSSPGR